MKNKIIPILAIALVMVITYLAINANGNSNSSDERTKGKSFEEVLKMAQKDKKKLL